MGDSGVSELGFTMLASATKEVMKRYEHESPDTEYSLQLTIGYGGVDGKCMDVTRCCCKRRCSLY